MSDLATWLLQQIAEDEAVAQAASPGPWHLNAERDEVIAVDDIEVAEVFALSGNQLRATAEHMARHDPARVLAECEAKRHLVNIASRPSLGAQGFRAGVEMAFNAALRLLTLPYADRPGYRQEWAP